MKIKQIILFIFLINIQIFSQPNEVSLDITIIVSRSDNGCSIPGAYVRLSGIVYGNFYANQEGVIKIKRKVFSYANVMHIGISECKAQGYYPAAKNFFSGGRSISGDFVLIRDINKNNPNTTINVVLSPINRNSGSLQKPKLLLPYNNAYVRSNIILKWTPVQNAYSYEIMYSRSNSFEAYRSKSMIIDAQANLSEMGTVIDRHILRRVLYKNENKIYWKVRAYDGNSLGDWSEVWSFSF